MSIPQTDDLIQLERDITSLELVTNPSTFAQALTRHGDVPEPWHPYAHLELLNRHVVNLLDPTTPERRLLVTMPPQHGKSMFCSLYLPAFFLNVNPTKRVMLCSYGDDYAQEWGRKIRNLISGNQHLLNISIASDSAAANKWDIQGTAGGLVTAGVGGQVTGRGAHLLIIDDPVKDAAEAASPTIRDQKWTWWRTTVQSRLRKNAVVLLIQTRWHEDDLAGRVLLDEPERWDIINLPCLAEDDDPLNRVPGTALCPELFPTEEMVLRRESVGNQAWSALYQQRPQPEGGGAFKKKDFRYWSAQPAEEKTYVLHDDDGSLLVPQKECWRFITMDLALTKRTASDYTVASVWDVAPWLTPSRLILVAVHRERLEGAEHVDFAKRLATQYRPSFIGVEEAMQGSMTLAFLQREGILTRALKHKSQDKPFRAKDAELLVENHRVYFPKKATWLGEWEHELLLFPTGTHDDQVDTFAYAAKELLTGVNMARRPKAPEPSTLEERCWAQLRGRHQLHDHPELGRWH